MSSLLTNLVSYYACEGNGNDSLGTNNLSTNANVLFGLPYGKILQGAGFYTATQANMTSAPANINFPLYGNPRTINFWVKSNPSPDFLCMNYGQDTGIPYQAFAVIVVSGSVWIGLGSGGVFNPTTSPPVNDGVFHMITVRFDGSIITIFIDGNLAATSGALPVDTQPGTLQVDDYQAGLANMNIDEIGVWSRALTPAEITTLYNGGLGLTYPFSPPTNASFLLNLL